MRVGVRCVQGTQRGKGQRGRARPTPERHRAAGQRNTDRAHALTFMPVIKHLPDSLRNHDIRRTCCAVEAILRAADMLDELPPECLEQIRDYCNELNEGRKGMFSEFKHAYINMVVEHLNGRRLRERRLYTGITGKEWPSLDEHQLPARTSITGNWDYEEHDKW
jgi:hypothetical protein